MNEDDLDPPEQPAPSEQPAELASAEAFFEPMPPGDVQAEWPYAPEPMPAQPPEDPRLPRLRKLDVFVAIAVVLLSGLVHFARLANPDRILPPSDEQCQKKFQRIHSGCHEQIPLDEWHYLPDARDVIRYGTESDTRVPADDGAFVVHPPVGKFFIAFGIRLFGDSGFGWRFFGALFGSLGVLILYLFALRLWRSPWAAAMAAMLLGVEGLWFVMSRIAMLDIYVSFFVLLAVWLLFEDRARTAPDDRGVRWWRIGAGLSFGLALASKWGAIPFFIGALGFAIAWELSLAFRAQDRPRLPWRALAMLFSLVVLPIAVYVATYTPWFLDGHRYNPPLCEDVKGLPRKWLCYQSEMANFHKDLKKYDVSTSTALPTAGSKTGTKTEVTKPGHPYFGNVWAWPWIGRPVAHYYVTTNDDKPSKRVFEIVGLPNPVIWIPAFLFGLPFLLWRALSRRDRIAIWLLGFIAVGWLPPLILDLMQRPAFLFYATPMVPFLVLTIVHLFVRWVRAAPRARMFAIAYVVIAAGVFAYLYPVLAAYPISEGGVLGWDWRMWLTSDCTVADQIKNFCWI